MAKKRKPTVTIEVDFDEATALGQWALTQKDNPIVVGLAEKVVKAATAPSKRTLARHRAAKRNKAAAGK